MVEKLDECQIRMRLGERRLECKSLAGSFVDFGRGFFERETAAGGHDDEGVRDAGIAQRVTRISGDRFPEVLESFSPPFKGLLGGPVAAPEIGVLGLGIDSVSVNEPAALVGSQLEADLLGDVLSNFVLQGNDVLQVALIGPCP